MGISLCAGCVKSHLGFGFLWSESSESASLLTNGWILQDGPVVGCSALVTSSTSPVSRREWEKGSRGNVSVHLAGP